MSQSKNSPTQKKRSRKRTQKVIDLMNKVMRGVFFPVPNTGGRVLTTLDPNSDCFHSKGMYLYIGTPLSQLEKYGEKSSPKMGKAELPVGKTINGSRDRYNYRDPFVILEVITVDHEMLEQHKVKTVRQLEEKLRKDNGFIMNDKFDGDEYWDNKNIIELIDLVHIYLFDGKRKQTHAPRIPQKRAIERMIDAFTKGTYKEFLLGAIMSFGKNFTFLYAVVEILKNKPNAKILVWTNRPGVFVSLETDITGMGSEHGGHIKFVDYSYLSMKESKDIQELPDKCVVTASKQLLENGKNSELLKFVEGQEWDFIIIDECHHGIETESAQKFLKKFKDTYKIYVSGTPQKQLGKIQFNDDNTFIYDEVSQKEDQENGIWSDAIILKTQLIKICKEIIKEYKECVINTNGYFTFGKFFSCVGGELVYQQSIIKFFEEYFGYNKFDQTLNFFGKHNHVAILVPSCVEATINLAEVLQNCVIGEDYEIVAATGERFKRNQLTKALSSGKKTITLLSDRLIEGETVPEWDCAINMSDGISIFKYLQFAFRPTRPNSKLPNKEAYFYDMNPQRHFLIQNERMRANGLKGEEKDNSLREWYKNFNIMIGGAVNEMIPVNFDSLKKESYSFGNMMRSINSLMFWENIDLDVMSNDLNSVEKQNSGNEKIDFNNNGIEGGKNTKNTKKKNTNESQKELEEIKSKWVTIMLRVPYVLSVEGCKTLDCLLDEYEDLDGMFEGAFGISQEVFVKYWNNPNFIDKYEMNFYFHNFAETI
jgi:superfamily II DNA or RNA helicase